MSLYFASVHCDKNVPLRSLHSGLGYEYILFFLIYLTTFCCVLFSTLIEYLVEYWLLTTFVVQDLSHLDGQDLI